MKLEDLEIYNISKEISKEAWREFNSFNWETKKTMGLQWIRAIDSVGANIAEGFGRYHYLDKNKFNYNARGSLIESIHWTRLLKNRSKINEEKAENIIKKMNKLAVKLNNYISKTRKQVKKKS